MSTTTATAPRTQALTPAEQRAYLLGCRAALIEEPRPRCYRHGFYDDEGDAPRRCVLGRRGCEAMGDVGEEPYAGECIEDGIFALVQRDERRGTRLGKVAKLGRGQKREAMRLERIAERDDDRRSREC